jgi:nitrogenase molybdenum-iron protein NifN
MAQLIKSTKSLAVQPLKAGQPLGGTLGALGIAQCLPMMHAAQGCSAFAKIFFIQHFREPIPLQSTAMDPITTIMGADENIALALSHIAEKSAAKLVVLMSNGLSEAQGADMSRALKDFRQDYPQHQKMAVVLVNAPDFYGSLENGYSAFMEAILDQLVPENQVKNIRKKRVNLLVGHSFNAGELEWLVSVVEAFGLTPVLVPDLSQSMDGHLVSDKDYLSVSQGGTSLNQIRQLGQSAMTLSLGSSVTRAAQRLSQRTDVPFESFPHLGNLEQCDHLIMSLKELSGRPVPNWIDRQRQQLLDTLIDTHSQLQGRRVALAGESENLGAWLATLAMYGMEATTVVAPANQSQLVNLPTKLVQVGDFEDLYLSAKSQTIDLLISNSHGSVIAEKLDVPLLRSGFPVFDRFGTFRTSRQGYAGLRDTAFEIANILLERAEHAPVYHSTLKQVWPQS